MTDAHQDQLLALWEKQPKTEDEAKAILKTLHHRRETARTNAKTREIQLDFDPPAKAPDIESELLERLQSLPANDRQMIEDHVLNEMSLSGIAKRDGVSKDTIRKRYNAAKRKLSELAKIR